MYTVYGLFSHHYNDIIIKVINSTILMFSRNTQIIQTWIMRNIPGNTKLFYDYC